jgi:adenine deaminase
MTGIQLLDTSPTFAPMQINANIVDITAGRIYAGTIEISGTKITAILVEGEEQPSLPYALPGFVDAHIHIESSMLVPSEFAKIAVQSGTVATVSDPHEIANVLGIKGVNFMLENAKKVPFKFFFGAPSCVPATSFETAGDVLDADQVKALLQRDDIWYLSEMMNYPGVLHHDEQVMAKLQAAKDIGKPIDGHAPGLTGQDAVDYINAGIETDHECFTYEEALWKLQNGMKIIIREGSAARNFEALYPLIDEFPDRVMLCSDDKHPDDLLVGHINQLAARAIEKGCDLFNVLRVACINAVEHYHLPVGLLRVGDAADIVLIRDLTSFDTLATLIDGKVIYTADPRDGQQSVAILDVPIEPINNFSTSFKSIDEFVTPPHIGPRRIIRALDGEIVTEEITAEVHSKDGIDVENDILKIVVVNRYSNQPPAVAFITGFGLKEGAIASSVAHDSHNIVAVGCDDIAIMHVVNLVIEASGGVAASDTEDDALLPLPVAGLMTNKSGVEAANAYTAVDRFSKEKLGSVLTAPFMTLSFMALLVIPKLKLSDLGLFDGERFEFV